MSNERSQWEVYKEHELALVTPALAALGYVLDEQQPHMQGERYLMHAVTTKSGRKLILLGRHRTTGQRVVIKATSETNGMRELEHERLCRRVLSDMKFAYTVFLSPEELFFGKRNGCLFSIQTFIDQESPFLARPRTEQFSLALRAFKAQEGAHATTYEHMRRVRNTFGTMNAKEYLAHYDEFMTNITGALPGVEDLHTRLAAGKERLVAGIRTIEQYGGFLTHTDFVPHNFRIHDDNIYLLDHSSLRFGNKYEGWARFVNFMTLYNPPLANALITYVKENRTYEETDSLTLMRIYRLGEILWYYTRAKTKSEGDLLTLNTARIDFWSEVLDAVLQNQPVPEGTIRAYQTLRDELRSPEEKERQKGLH